MPQGVFTSDHAAKITGMAEYLLKCEECGGEMSAKRRDKRFCSTSCLQKERYRRTLGRSLAAQRENVPCARCGKPFTPKRIDALYCSKRCARGAYNENNREAIRERQRAWVGKNPEKRQEILQRYADRHPDDGKDRYAKLKADPERWARAQEQQRGHYLANREEYLRRAKERRTLQPTLAYQYKHGTDWGDLFAMLWDAQDGKCYLCGDNLDTEGYRKIHLDHDHRCCPNGKTCEKCRRGLACHTCNVAIGLVRDNPARLHFMADNLAAAIALVDERLRA